MNFLISDTFTDSLARLTGGEQKAVKTAAFDLQMDPSAPGLRFHKLDKAKDKRFREQADRLLAPEITDVDGNREERRHTVSVFNGPAPQVLTLATDEEMCAAVSVWLGERIADGVRSVRSCDRRT